MTARCPHGPLWYHPCLWCRRPPVTRSARRPLVDVPIDGHPFLAMRMPEDMADDPAIRRILLGHAWTLRC